MIPPPASSRQLTDFLNHGVLPFVGRRTELARLESFWRASREAERLRVAMLVGEAGAGKSRLVAALAARVRHEGGLELRATLHPEAANAIAPHLTQAIWYSDFGRALVREEPDGSLAAAIAALRRLARLRPALIVIEDLHLVAAEAVPELARIVDALADEPLTILCTARPSALPARAALQPYLTEEIDLRGLDHDDLGMLWELLLGWIPSAPVLDALASTTAGNPLAVRSALRSAVHELRARPGLSDDDLVASLQRDAGLMHEGLVAHLPDPLREAAARIAQLGEIISPETASMLIGGDRNALERLMFAGILAPAGSAPPRVSGVAETAPPLAFTHSLVHRHLAESRPPDLLPLARLLVSGAAIYTVLPYELVSDAGDAIAREPDLLLELHTGMHEVARTLDTRGQWQAARRLVELADRLAVQARSRLDEQRRRRLDDEVAVLRLSLLRDLAGSDDYARLIERALAITSRPRDVAAARSRLFVLHYATLDAMRRNAPERARALGAEVDALLERFAEAIGSIEHALGLSGRAQVAVAFGDDDAIEAIEREFRRLLAAPIDERVRAELLLRVAPLLLLRIDSPEQLEERRTLFTLIRRTPGSRTPFVETVAAEFLAIAGDYTEAAVEARRALRLSTDAGRRMNVINARLTQLVIEASTAPLDDAAGDRERLEECIELLDRVPDALRPSYVAVICTRLGRAGWLRLDDEWMRSLAQHLASSAASAEFDVADAILLEMATTMSPAQDDEPLARLRDAIEAGRRDADTAGLAETILATRPASAPHVVRLRAAIELVAPNVKRFATDASQRLRAALAGALDRAIAWQADHGLADRIERWLERYGSLLPADARQRWRNRSSEAAPRTGGEIVVSMIGEIRYGPPGEEGSRLRGVRNRTLLGLMVALEAIASRGTPSPAPAGPEFWRLATGIEDDPDRARRMTNVAIHRLRELIGREAIDTSGEVPRLDRRVVSVDLLDALAQLDEADRALRDGKLARAARAAREALTTLDGEVAWPTLYGPIFEAARDELDTRLRSTIVRLGESLLREGDLAGAEELLRPAVEALGGDDEVRELLEETLAARGRHVESELVRSRAGREDR